MNMGTNIEVSANHSDFKLMNSHRWLGTGTPYCQGFSLTRSVRCQDCGRSFYDTPNRCPARVVAHWKDIPPRWHRTRRTAK